MPPVASKQKHFGFGYSHTKEAEFLARFFCTHRSHGILFSIDIEQS